MTMNREHNDCVREHNDVVFRAYKNSIIAEFLSIMCHKP